MPSAANLAVSLAALTCALASCATPLPELEKLEKTGFVFINQGTFLDVPFSQVLISFTVAEVTPESRCETRAHGDCTAHVCETQWGDEPATPEYHDAGRITVSGGIWDVATVPGGDSRYAVSDELESRFFNGGELLTFTADGGSVPAFERTLSAPRRIVIASPALTESGGLPSTKDDFTISWDQGGQGDVVLRLSENDFLSWGPSFGVVCTYPAVARRGVIPAEAMTHLRGQVAVSIDVQTHRVLSPGDGWDVSLWIVERSYTCGTWLSSCR